MKKVLTLFMIFAIVLCSSSLHALADEKDGKYIISGTVSLPSGMVAPAEGTEIKLMALHDIYNYGSTLVRISGGESDAQFVINIKHHKPGYDYLINYQITDGLVADCFTYGYYGEEGIKTSKDMEEAFVIKGVSAKGINIDIPAYRIISGRFSLPNGKLALSGGIEVQILVSVQNPAPESPNVGGNSKITIPEGQNFIDYKISIHSDQDTDFLVSYNYEGKNIPYCRNGYYGLNGTTDYFSATPLYLDDELATGIDMTMVEGRFITGTAYLVGGAVAPEGGLKVRVGASVCIPYLIEKGVFQKLESNDPNETGAYSSDKAFFDAGNDEVVIPEGESSAEYRVQILPHSTDIPYYLTYGAYMGENSRLWGYYQEDVGMTEDFDAATPVYAGINDSNENNLPIVLGKTISGKLIIPEGKAAPNKDLNIVVYAQAEKNSYVAYVTIQKGRRECDYIIAIPKGMENQNYKLGYYTVSQGEYKPGYYSISGTTSQKAKAGSVSVSNGNLVNINIVLYR